MEEISRWMEENADLTEDEMTKQIEEIFTDEQISELIDLSTAMPYVKELAE